MLKNNIKALRKEQKITIRELEKKVHINRATLSRIENGLQNLSDDYIYVLSTFFDVSTDYLLGLSNIRKPEIEKEMISDWIFMAIYEEFKDLTETQKVEMLSVIKFIKSMKK